MLKRSTMKSRAALGAFLNKHKLNGVGVEVGTHRGEYAKILLDKWAPGTLYCVDPWVNLPEYEPQVRFLANSKSRDQDFAHTQKVLQKHAARVKYMQMTSEAAAPSFSDESIDFAYIDGNHSDPYVTQDINLWWPKVKTGGMLFGHDFMAPDYGDIDWTVDIQKAVMLFAAEHNKDIYVIPEPDDTPWSFCIYK